MKMNAIETHAKSVLLHTLGNINHDSSKQIIFRHLKEKGMNVRLRRSAVKALRKYACDEVSKYVNEIEFLLDLKLKMKI